MGEGLGLGGWRWEKRGVEEGAGFDLNPAPALGGQGACRWAAGGIGLQVA